MATIVNNPAPSSDGGGYGGLILGLFILLAIILLIYFGVPALRRASTPSVPQVNVPEKVDINVNQNP